TVQRAADSVRLLLATHYPLLATFFSPMPKLGFNLLVWTAAISEKYFTHIERLKKIGYDGIEICMGHEQTQPYKDTAKFVRDLGLGITCVTIVGADANPVSPDKAVRQKAVEKLKWNIDRTVDC